MKKDTRIVLFLLLISPAMGELMSGSAPPLEFFNPLMLIILVLLYGCGTLLIREARSRWGLQWSVIFLAVAYGIIEEGLMVKSFFNPDWQDLNDLAEYGELLGVQWSWTIMLIIYHATISTLIPIAIADSLWPDYKEKPLLGRKGLTLVSAGFIFVTILGMIFFGHEEDGKYVAYHPNALLLIFCFIIVLTLLWLAFKFRKSRVVNRNRVLLTPVQFGVAGFLTQSTNVLLPFVLADNGVNALITLSLQLLLSCSIILFMVRQLLHQDSTLKHKTFLIFGSALFWLIAGPVTGFHQGMLAVSVAGLGLLIWWCKKVLKTEERLTA